MKILYVEANPGDVDLTRSWLGRHAPQLALETVSGQSEALNRLTAPDARSFDLVITDLQLPDGDGLSLLRYIRGRDLPLAVVVITGAGDEDAAVAAMKAGADHYVAKCKDYLERLPSTLEQALQHHRAHRAPVTPDNAALSDSEARNRAILEAVPDLMFLQTTDGVYLDFHANDASTLLVLPEQFLGRNMREVLPAELAERFAKCFEEVAASGKPGLVEYSLPILGKERHYEARVAKCDRDKVLAVVRDISERKQAEAVRLMRAELLADINAALAEREGALQHVLQQCAEAVTRHLDAAFARIWTLSHEESVLELQASAGQYTHLNGSHSRIPVGELKIGQIAQERKPHLTNDVCNDARIGDQQWAREQEMVAFAGYPLLVEDRVVGVMAMFARHELTEDAMQALATAAAPIAQGIERKRTEQALRESEERFRDAFDHSAIGMALVAPDMRPLEVNRSLCELLGYSEQELLATDFRSLTHPDDVASCLVHVQRTLGGGTQVFQIEKRYIHKNGHVVWVLMSASLLRASDGQPLYFISEVQDITERKQAEQRLRESEERFRQLAENIGAVFYITEDFNETSPGRVLYISPAYEKIWGRSCESVYQDSRSFLDAIHPEDRQRVSAAVYNARTKQFNEEFRVVRPDGEVRWVHDRVFPIRDERGEVYRLAGVVEDITERRQIEEALRESQLRYSLATTAGCVGVWDWNLETGEIYVDPALKAVLGFEDHEIENLIDGWGTRVHPDDVDCVTREAQAHIDGLTPYYQVEHRMLHKDGSIRWFLARGAVVEVKNGSPRRMVGTDTDITDRKRAELALRESEERARRTLVEQMLAGVSECDAAGRFVLVNQRFCDILGYTEGELLEMGVQDITHRDDLPRITELFQGLAKTGDSFVVENRFHRKDGAEVWVNSSVSPIRNGQGEVVQSVAIVIDVTDRKRAEREREQLLKQEKAARAEAQAASRSKDEFMAVVSHELRSPLSSILGYTRLLRMGAADAAETRRMVEIIERNGKMQLRLIEDLLDTARIISGKLKLEVQPVELLGVVVGALDVMRPAAQAKGIELCSELEPLAGPMTGDPNRLQQIVWNLLSNAIKFTPRSGRVQLRLENVHHQVRITVNDTGKGIEPEFLPFVFDRFRQSDSSSARRFGGLGLGLSLVKQLVELHGGTIEAASDGPGSGATFTVTLPQHAVQAESFIPQQPRTAPRGLETEDVIQLDPAMSLAGVRVLAVDDEEEALSLLKTILARCDAEVIAASSGVEAVRILAKPSDGKQFDVLVLDITMPDQDGYQTLERVRALETEKGITPSGQIPAIALTALGRTEDRLKTLAAGFRVHLVKPVEPADLVSAIAGLVERRSAAGKM